MRRRLALLLLASLLPASGSQVVDAIADPADDAENATAPVSVASTPKMRKKVVKRKKKRAKPAKPAKPSWYDIRARAQAFRTEFSQQYNERVAYLEAQAEVARLERQRQEAKLRDRLAQLRAEAASGQVSNESDEDIALTSLEQEQGALTLSEQAALIGTLLGSPAGIVGVVLGGAAGGAAGFAVEKVEGLRSSVSRAYAERLHVEEAAAEQQAAMSEELQCVANEVTLVDHREEAEQVGEEALHTCREELSDFLALPHNRRCADCAARLPALQDCWASVNLGVLVCMRCAALHRGLGVGNSRIKSLVYDHWDVPAARRLMQVGNERARELYLARLPVGQKPPGKNADEERLRSWLTNKYVRLKWAEPEWRASLMASRLRASKVASAPARGRKVGKLPRKMPSLSSEG